MPAERRARAAEEAAKRQAERTVAVPEADREILRTMAAESGWIEEGGKAVGARTAWEETALGIKSRREMTEAGMGRTKWIGKPEWAKGFGYSVPEMKAIVEKAIAGKPLGSKQRLAVQAMLDELREGERLTAEAEAVAEAASDIVVDHLADKWPTMAEDEKDAALDALFAGRPEAPAAKGEGAREAASEAEARREVPAEREPGEDDEVEREPVGRDGMRQEDRDRATLDSNVAEFDAQVREQDDVASTVLAGAKSWAKDNGLDDGAFRRALHKKWRDDKSQRMRDLAHAMLGPVSATESSEKAALDKLSDTEWRRAVDVPKAVLRALEDKGLVESQPYTTSELGGQGLEWRKVTPESKARKEAFERDIAARKERRAALAKRLAVDLDRDGGVRATMTNGHSLLLTKNISGTAPYRVTSFLKDGTPIGHTEYESINGRGLTGAVHEFMGEDTKFEGRPALDLTQQTEADLKAKEAQAATGKTEEQSAAVRDRDTAVLTPPEGTAPARDATEAKVPTQQEGLFGNAVAALRTAADELEKAAKSETEKPAPQTDLWRVSRDEIMKQEDGVRAKAHEHAVALALLRGEEVPDDAVPYQWRDSERDGFVKRARERGPLPAEIVGAETDIPLDTAERAFAGTSHVPERRGRNAVEEYVATIKADFDSLRAKADTEDKRATLNTMFAEYRGGYRSRYLAWLGAHSRVMSAMITGPAKFPTASNAKRSTSADRRYQELREFRKRALDRIVGEIAPQEARAISSDDPEAVAKLKEKLSAVEALQARMRAVNEAHRKFLKDPASLDASSLSDKDKERVRAYKPAYSWEPHPFAPYQLSNNNAEIKRLTERIASIEQRSADTTREQQFDGFKVVDSVESNRLQIFFPGKPDEATRSKLKANGFKWAPSEGAWQRFRGPGAETALERALGVKFEPKPATGEGTQDAGDKDVRFSRQADAINEYALERGTDKRGQPAFANQHIVIANAVPDPVSRGEGAQSYTWTIYDRTNPGEKGSRFRKVGTLYADLGPDGKFEKLRLIETYRRYRQKGLGYGESVLASMLASNGRGYRMGIQNIVHHVEPKDADALPFWRKMGVRLLNYATDPSVEINGDVSLEDYLRARGERSSFNRDANRGRTESLAEGTQGALAPEGQARARRDTRGDEPGADGRGDRGRQGVLGREPGSARGARAEVARRAASIREAVEPIIKAWGNAPEVVLIDSMADAPAAVRAQDEGQRSQGATGAPEAFIYRNKVYLVAEGIASPAAAVRALLHESVGHFGLRQVFGEQLDPVLDDVARSFAGRVRAKATEYGLDFENREQRRHAAEEVLAELAATMPRAGVVRRAIAAIREFLRSLGIDLDLSDNDIIVNFILPAREFVERSQIRGREAVPAAAFERERPWYYSALERSLRDLKQGAAPATQWKATIKALKGVSKDEIEWSGVNEWLDTRQGKVTKDEVMDFLAQNGVRVEETVLSNEARAKEGTGESDRLKVEIDALGYDVVDDRIDEVFGVRRRSDGALFSDSGFAERGADFGGYIEELPEGVREKVERLGQLLATAEEDEFSQTSSRPRYSQYTLPGGENYRELLLTLPTRGRYRAGVLGNGMFAVYDERAQQVKDAGEFIDIGDAEVTAEDMNAKERGKRPGEQFRSSHFDQANILAHVRFDERTDANGKRVLFIEEIQSDWAQKGKREGFKKRPDQVTDAEREAARQYFGVKGWDEMPQDQHTAYALEMLDKRAVPPAPFVGKTEAWVSLALKRMIRYAAEHGFDRVAWTTGAQQADRYDLSKHVSHINWNRLDDGSYSFQAYGKNYDDGGNPIIKQSGVKPEGIADFIGKEAAEKILNARGTRGSLSNLDLKIGGEGMRAFYDKIVPNVTNGILKKFGGGRVSEVTITMPAAESDPDAAVRLVAGRDVVDREQPGFDITPAMREAAGQGLPMFSRAAAATPDDARITLERSAMPSARELFEDLTHSDRKLNRVISKFNTPFHIAETHPEFKPVYREAQDYSLDVSRIVNEAADLAKDLLPRIEGMADFKKKTPSTGDVGAIADALYAGTLWGNGSPLEGRVWTDEELKQGKAIDNGVGLPAFKPLTEAQIELYRQALASVAHSVTEHSKALIWRLAKMRKIILDRGMSLEDMAESARRDADVELAEVKADFNTREDERTARMNAAEGAAVGEISKEGRQDADRVQKQVDELEAFKASVSDIETKTKGLVEHGYFPAMRFGKYAVNVDRARPNGTREELYFGRFETQVAANMAKRELQREFPGARVTSGVMNDDAHKLFQGLNLDALELFAEHLVDENGEKVSADPIMQQYFRVATTERSALKRQIHRKGTPGFSKDVPRALAQFTVSQATSASRSYHAAGMLEKVRGIKAGDLQAYATRYVRYLQDPQEEAAALRGFLANYYILGSIAFGAINMTQPVLMSAPYLTQYTGWAKSMAALGKAAVDLVGGRKNLTAEEADAYARAAKAGVVSPQEIHQIRAETRASMLGDSPLWQKLEGIAEAKGLHLPGKLLLRKAAFLWGSIYALTEQFNRGTTFIAAYRIARETGQGDAYEFARKAVDATQGVYLRTNRPEISRGPAGATIMTFKQFSIAYLELAKRLYDHDKKAFAVLMLTLIALAGAEGLPFAEDIEDLVDTIGQWLGYGTNSRKRIRHFATDLLGPDIADIMLHGFSAIPGVPLDVANRLGMHNLIPGSAILKASEPDKTRDITDLLGPAASIFKNAGLALEGLATGRPGETKLLLPKALQDLGKAVEMVETGAYKDTKGRRVMDVDAMDAAVKFVGFQPAKVARETRIIGQNYQDIALHKVMESAIAGKWARGLADGDEAEVEEARAQWRAWNEANPELRIAINRQQLRRRVKELQAAREGRLVKSAPREIRGEVARDLQR